MRNYDIEITQSLLIDETGRKTTVFGLTLKGESGILCYPDLVTNKQKLEHLCLLLDDEFPTERLLLELFDDHLFSPAD